MAKLLSSTVLCMCLWLMPLLLILQQQHFAECRYLPTRSHGDDLDKLRELMLQILESSNEEQRQPNDGSSNNVMPQHASWLNKLSSLEAAPRKYGGGNRAGYYEAGHYY